MGLRPKRSPASLAALGDTIMPARSVSCAINGEKGFFRFSLMVSGSTTSIVSIAASSGLRNEPVVLLWGGGGSGQVGCVRGGPGGRGAGGCVLGVGADENGGAPGRLSPPNPPP